MKILYTITKSEIGGAQVHVLQLAKHMKDEGHAVAIMSSPLGWLENEATKLGIRFYPNPYFANSFNPFRALKAFSLVKKTSLEFSPDIVHAHSSFAGVITRIAIRNKIPTIFTAHSWAFTNGASVFRKVVASIVERYISKYSSKIICVSEFDRKLALRFRIAQSEKLVAVHNGVKNQDTNSIRSNSIVSVGRLTYPKEYGLLLEAFKQAKVSMNLEIIGDGPDKESILEKIIDLGLTDRVSLLGALAPEEVRNKLSSASVFALISKHEGLPLTIIEAMSAGLPVIASRVGGIPEEIDETCGILVENNVEEISTAIKLLSDQNKQRQMGESARRKFENEFTLEKFIHETELVYRSLVGENNLHRF